MERAQWKRLMYKLIEHKRIGHNLDLLISKLRQKQLLRSDVQGSTVSERVENLVADLNATFNGRSDSFVADFLEVLRSIAAFEDLAEQCTTNNDFADSIKPEQATDSVSGKSGSDCSSDCTYDISMHALSRIKVRIGSFIERCDNLQKKKDEVAYVAKQADSDKVDQANVLELETTEPAKSGEMQAAIAKITKHIQNAAEFGEQAGKDLKNERVKLLKYDLNASELRAERAEQRAERAEHQLAQQEEDFEIKRLELRKEIQELQEEITQLKAQLDAQKQLRCTEELQQVNENMDNLQIRVNQLEQGEESIQIRVNRLEQGVQEKVGNLQTRMNRLEQEREESCSPGRLNWITLYIYELAWLFCVNTA